MIEKAPIRFLPHLKSVIWGGNKICSYKDIPQPAPNIGESWEISAVPGHESVVSEGSYEGLTITELIDRFGSELLGDMVVQRYNGKFPLLIKFIDAADNLSVQVHPDDALAKVRHNSLGKTEMWYIIQADKDARIYAGLNTEMTSDDYVKRVKEGTFAETLAVHDSHPGDVFFLPAGRVHAIGAGNLLAEIQESSDVTYRIYDYNRLDTDGNSRELHTEQAKDAIDFTLYENYKSPAIADDVKKANLVSCSHFDVFRLIVSDSCKLEFDSSSFTVIMCIEGNFTIELTSGTMIVRRGQTILCPAILNEMKLNGNASLLIARIMPHN